MSTGETQIPLPIVLFFSGIIPIILYLILGFLGMLNLHGGLGTMFLLLLVIIMPPICFGGGCISALRSTGQYRRTGLALNGLGLGVLLSLLVYGLLMN
jgi:hypothetical protein